MEEQSGHLSADQAADLPPVKTIDEALTRIGSLAGRNDDDTKNEVLQCFKFIKTSSEMNELKNVNPDDLKRWAHPIALMTQSNNQEIRELAESQLKKIVAERPEIKTESHASVCHLYNQEIGNFAENAIRLTDSLQINVLHVSSAQNSTKKTFNHTKGQKIVIRMPMYPSNVANNCKARIKRLAKINKNKSVEWNMRKLLQDMRGDQKLINIIKKFERVSLGSRYAVQGGIIENLTYSKGYSRMTAERRKYVVSSDIVPASIVTTLYCYEDAATTAIAKMKGHEIMVGGQKKSTMHCGQYKFLVVLKNQSGEEIRWEMKHSKEAEEGPVIYFPIGLDLETCKLKVQSGLIDLYCACLNVTATEYSEGREYILKMVRIKTQAVVNASKKSQEVVPTEKDYVIGQGRWSANRNLNQRKIEVTDEVLLEYNVRNDYERTEAAKKVIKMIKDGGGRIVLCEKRDSGDVFIALKGQLALDRASKYLLRRMTYHQRKDEHNARQREKYKALRIEELENIRKSKMNAFTIKSKGVSDTSLKNTILGLDQNDKPPDADPYLREGASALHGKYTFNCHIPKKTYPNKNIEYL